VRLISETGEQLGVLSLEDALDTAGNKGLDLIEVAPNATPPVCKILDFGKYKYQLAMKEKESKKKQHVIKIKEVRFRPRIDIHDLEMKVNRAYKFLEKGNKVKLVVMFRGRELAHTEVGFELLDKIVSELSEIGKVEKPAKREGRTIVAFVIAK